eukprot:scaffold6301_cov165-Amphora_coffeaeformis.AAC.14
MENMTTEGSRLTKWRQDNPNRVTEHKANQQVVKRVIKFGITTSLVAKRDIAFKAEVERELDTKEGCQLPTDDKDTKEKSRIVKRRCKRRAGVRKGLLQMEAWKDMSALYDPITGKKREKPTYQAPTQQAPGTYQADPPETEMYQMDLSETEMETYQDPEMHQHNDYNIEHMDSGYDSPTAFQQTLPPLGTPVLDLNQLARLSPQIQLAVFKDQKATRNHESNMASNARNHQSSMTDKVIEGHKSTMDVLGHLYSPGRSSRSHSPRSYGSTDEHLSCRIPMPNLSAGSSFPSLARSPMPNLSPGSSSPRIALGSHKRSMSGDVNPRSVKFKTTAPAAGSQDPESGRPPTHPNSIPLRGGSQGSRPSASAGLQSGMSVTAPGSVARKLYTSPSLSEPETRTSPSPLPAPKEAAKPKAAPKAAPNQTHLLHAPVTFGQYEDGVRGMVADDNFLGPTIINGIRQVSPGSVEKFAAMGKGSLFLQNNEVSAFGQTPNVPPGVEALTAQIQAASDRLNEMEQSIKLCMAPLVVDAKGLQRFVELRHVEGLGDMEIPLILPKNSFASFPSTSCKFGRNFKIALRFSKAWLMPTWRNAA